MTSKPNFYEEWIRWAVRMIEEFAKRGDLPSLELFGRDAVGLIYPYTSQLAFKYLFDPLKPLREGMRAMRKRWTPVTK